MTGPHRKLKVVLAASALVLVASNVGCRGEAEVENTASAQQDTPIPPEKLVEEGAKTFAANCTGCHGKQAEGRVGMGPGLASETFLAAASDEMLIATINKGRPGTTMAPWGSMLPPSQVEALAAYIRSLVPHERAELDESPLHGDVSAGEEVFRTICGTCHGRNGGGYMESSSGTGIGRKVFLDEVSNGYLRYIIKNGKTGTQMKSFREGAPAAVANLSDQQIEDVIAYIRASAW